MCNVVGRDCAKVGMAERVPSPAAAAATVRDIDVITGVADASLLPVRTTSVDEAWKEGRRGPREVREGIPEEASRPSEEKEGAASRTVPREAGREERDVGVDGSARVGISLLSGKDGDGGE